MYEQAWRLAVEQSSANSLQALQRQHSCLVAAVTCLQLVDEENQWILHPITMQDTREVLLNVAVATRCEKDNGCSNRPSMKQSFANVVEFAEMVVNATSLGKAQSKVFVKATYCC